MLFLFTNPKIIYAPIIQSFTENIAVEKIKDVFKNKLFNAFFHILNWISKFSIDGKEIINTIKEEITSNLPKNSIRYVSKTLHSNLHLIWKLNNWSIPSNVENNHLELLFHTKGFGKLILNYVSIFQNLQYL